MEKQEPITLYRDDYNTNSTMTFKELYEEILKEIETYTKLGLLDELMDQKVKMEIVDLEGQILKGYMTSGLIGWLESGDVLLAGNLEDVYFKKSTVKCEHCNDKNKIEVRGDLGMNNDWIECLYCKEKGEL